MLTPRGIAVALAGVGMWVAARILGSPGLETVAIGLLLLPFIAGGVRPLGDAHDPRATPPVRAARGARYPCDRPARRDARRPPQALVPVARGPAAGRPSAGLRALVVAGSARALQRVSYTVVPHARGRYVIGPMAVDRTDAFGLTRRRVLLDGRDELLVTPEVEDLRAPAEPRASQHRQRAGAPAAAQRRGVLHDARLRGRRRPPPDPLALGRADRHADDPPGRGVPPGGRADLPRQPRVDARARARRGVRARRVLRGEHRRAVHAQRVRAAARHGRDRRSRRSTRRRSWTCWRVCAPDAGGRSPA